MAVVELVGDEMECLSRPTRHATVLESNHVALAEARSESSFDGRRRVLGSYQKLGSHARLFDRPCIASTRG